MSKRSSKKGMDQAAPLDLSEGLSVDELLATVEQLESNLEEAVAARQRALADYANFERRSRENEERARSEGARSVLRSLLPVVDHFELALNQDVSSLTVEQLYGGVKIVRDELTKAMESHGVTRIAPKAGDPFDPERHEAMMRQPAEGVQPNHVVATLQAGFSSGNFVLRPAKVSVAPDEESAPTEQQMEDGG